MLPSLAKQTMDNVKKTVISTNKIIFNLFFNLRDHVSNISECNQREDENQREI